jgi:hypothetical protein
MASSSAGAAVASHRAPAVEGGRILRELLARSERDRPHMRDAGPGRPCVGRPQVAGARGSAAASPDPDGHARDAGARAPPASGVGRKASGLTSG